MLTTRFTRLAGVEHPVVLGGMGTGTSAPLVSAVSAAGGLGILSASHISPEKLRAEVAAIRAATDRPFGLNYLLAFCDDEHVAIGLALRPKVMSFAWPRLDQDLSAHFARAHEIGALVVHMVSTAAEAVRVAAAGADVIVAQGTEGGGHVGQMASMVLIPQVVRAVPDRPILAAGGVANGAGLAAALAFGADGVLLGTRFLATPEAPIHPNYKQAIVDSDGTDTILTDIPDIIQAREWPGATNRVVRNRLIEKWLGREPALRQHRAEEAAALARAREAGDREWGSVGTGQIAGLIDRIEPAGDIVRRISAEGERIIAERLAGLVSGAGAVAGGR
ncbi:MAG TPA: nitronate monooxygenase [Chloroflexota bacterium]|nr:nitronate monooxygenase [Chloroflexota bacterium]